MSTETMRSKVVQVLSQKGLSMRAASMLVNPNNPNFVRDIVRGRKKTVHDSDVKSLATALHISEKELTGQLEENLNVALLGPSVPLPVYGEIPAGNPTWAEGVQDPIDVIPGSEREQKNGYFALRVCGNSMAPKYLTGDIIVLRPLHIELPIKDPKRPVPRATFDALVGKFVAVLVNGEATVKQLKVVGKSTSDYEILLEPINAEEYETIRVSETDECRFQGVVVRVERYEE